MVIMSHIILESIIDIGSSKRSEFHQRVKRLGLGLENHLTIIRRIEVILPIQHLVEPLVAIRFLANLGQGDIGIPRRIVVRKGNRGNRRIHVKDIRQMALIATGIPISGVGIVDGFICQLWPAGYQT